MEKQKHANQHYHHRHQPIKILQAHCSHCITWWTLQCGQSARTSMSTTQSKKQRPQSGISVYELCKWKSRQATGTIRSERNRPMRSEPALANRKKKRDERNASRSLRRNPTCFRWLFAHVFSSSLLVASSTIVHWYIALFSGLLAAQHGVRRKSSCACELCSTLPKSCALWASGSLRCASDHVRRRSWSRVLKLLIF